MSEKKNTITRAAALEAVIRLAKEQIEVDDTWNEVIEVLTKMHTQITKPRKKSDAPSKARILNEALAAKCYDAMEGQDNVSSKWLIEHVNGLMTPQKTTAVMRILIDEGKVIRNKEGKTITYSRAE